MSTSLEVFAGTLLGKHFFLVVFGAIVHALTEFRAGHTKGFLDVIILAFISSFTGVIFSLFALHYFPNSEYLTLAIAGSGGYLGVEGMSWIVKRLKQAIIAK